MSSKTLIAISTVAVGVLDRRGLDDRPPLLAGRADAEAHDGVVGLLAGQRDPPGKSLRRERLAVLVEDLEAAHDLRDRRGEQLLHAAVAERLDGRVVRVDQAAVGRLRRHAVGDAGEDEVELVARPLQLLRDARALREEARVVERERGAAGEVLGVGQVLRPVAARRLVAERRGRSRRGSGRARGAARRAPSGSRAPCRSRACSSSWAIAPTSSISSVTVGDQLRLAGADRERQALAGVRVGRDRRRAAARSARAARGSACAAA